MTLKKIAKNEKFLVGTFYIQKVDFTYELCLCIGVNHYATKEVWVFLTICSLLGSRITDNVILDHQCWDLQMFVNYVFSKPVESEIFSYKVVQNGIVEKYIQMFYSPYQYQIPEDINVWYLKQRMLNKTIPELNITDAAMPIV